MATQKEDLKSYIKSINEKVPATVEEKKAAPVAVKQSQKSCQLSLLG